MIEPIFLAVRLLGIVSYEAIAYIFNVEFDVKLIIITFPFGVVYI